jgi:nicotinamidase-related amidase
MTEKTPSQAALVVIDVQKSFYHAPYWSERDLPMFQQSLLALIDGCVARSVPVVRVFHVAPKGPFALESGHVQAMDWLPDTHAVEFHKHVHNAFTDTGLDRWLRGRKVDRLIVSGIRTEQCCETTTRVASDLGYAVDFVTEATLTFAMTHAGGRTYATEEIKEKTELVLAGRFASIRTVAECLASL